MINLWQMIFVYLINAWHLKIRQKYYFFGYFRKLEKKAKLKIIII